MLTPYQFDSNTPIQAIDLDGLEAYHYIREFSKQGEPVLRYIGKEDIFEKVIDGYRNSTSFGNDGAIPIYETVKNRIEKHIVTETRDGTIDINGGINGVRFVDYNVDVTYNSLDDALAGANGTDDFGDVFAFRFAQYQAAIKIENSSGGGGGGLIMPLLKRRKFKPLDYSDLKEPRTVGPFLKTTKSQRDRIIEYNKAKNNGKIINDEDRSILNPPTTTKKGEKADMNAAEVDHIWERSVGGSNSNSNQRVVSKKQNLDKEVKRRKGSTP